MRRCRPLLGTLVEIDGDDVAVIEAGFAAIAEVHRQMSAHAADSDLGRVNRLAHLAPVAVGEWTARAVEAATHWARRSDGGFDIVRAGAQALRRGALPLHPGQPRPDPAADWRAVQIRDGAISLSAAACLDLGGIAKGLAVDLAVEAMRAAGAGRGLVNAGGDLRGFGDAPWPVTVVDPSTRAARVEVELRDQALATSAGLRLAPGRLDFGHLVGTDPQFVSISVCAATCCDADALTKILWRAPQRAPERAAALLEAAGARAFAIRGDGAIAELGVPARAAA